MKTLVKVQRTNDRHWVGDGFPVRTLLSYDDQRPNLSPFLLLDYAGPAEFAPSVRPRGVGRHPHRGFETVTVVYQGEVEHQDSAGNAGKVGPGDVQWMTAASGVVHEERHERGFARRGVAFEVVQLWVNLPAAHKMGPPGYQHLPGASIPSVALPGDAEARVIAGELLGLKGVARTFTPMNVWDVRLPGGRRTELELPGGQNAMVVVLRGRLVLNDQESLAGPQVALLDRGGGTIALVAPEPAGLLVLSGEPIDEPVVSHGPFVMNTEAEIRQAFADYRSRRMGRLPA